MPTLGIVLEKFSKDEMFILTWLLYLVINKLPADMFDACWQNKGYFKFNAILLFCMMPGPIDLMIGFLATPAVEDSISIPTSCRMSHC